jgi:glycosyl hydrolase family 76
VPSWRATGLLSMNVRMPAHRPGLRTLATTLLLAGSLVAAPATAAPTRTAGHTAAASTPAQYGQLADAGLRATARWRNRRLGWWNDRLNDHARYPLATIWSAVPLWEALVARDQATHSPAASAALRSFARGAERYWDPAMHGYGPYPGDRNRERVWFDDNGWWGLGFADTYTATGDRRYLRDAERAFRFVASQGWAPDGGLWWNTSHPYKSGEALASNSLLGALIYQATRDPYYLTQVQKFIAWADAHLTDGASGLYEKSDLDPTPMPYVEGPMIAAHEVLCRATGDQSLCTRAEDLARRAQRRFASGLNMGPQYDAIYLHWMLYLWSQDRDPQWWQLAERNAERARDAAGAGGGLYPLAWDGGSMASHQAGPGLLRTQAATVELFAWLSAYPAP